MVRKKYDAINEDSRSEQKGDYGEQKVEEAGVCSAVHRIKFEEEEKLRKSRDLTNMQIHK